MKKSTLLTLVCCAVSATLLAAGCTSPSSTAVPSVIPTATGNVTATLDAYFTAHYPLIDNFTLRSNASAGEPRIYTGTIQRNGTLDIINLFPANSSNESQGQFSAQRASYNYYAAQRNATIVANTSNHWSVASGATTVNVWQVEANAVGPYGLALDSPYVLVSLAETVITSGVQ
jgi:hypothetical protein